jgi:hypothetical protein
MGKTGWRHQRHSGQRNYQTMGHLISPDMRDTCTLPAPATADAGQ